MVAARPSPGEHDLAYGVVAQLLRTAVERLGDELPGHCAGEAARLLPELGPPPPASLDDPGARLRFLEAVGQLIALACDGRAAGVVFVDDLHWCDPASLDALAYLARRLHGRRLLADRDAAHRRARPRTRLRPPGAGGRADSHSAG